MSARGSGTAARTAWSLFGAVLVLQVLSWVLTLSGDDVTPVFDAVSTVAVIVMPGIGALVAARHPRNPIGWLFLGSGLLFALSAAAYGWTAAAYAPGASLGAGPLAAWLSSWVFLPAVFGVPPLVFLLFPDGRTQSPRWRAAVWLTVAGVMCLSLGGALNPGPLEDVPVRGIDNPFGVDATVVRLVRTAGWVVGLAALVPAVWSLVLRFRRSRGEERLQLTWLALSAVLFGLACLVSAVLFQTRWDAVGQLVVVGAYLTIPAAAAVAILRYRLYDIDVVINRALVYGCLTAMLAGVYVGSVLLLQLVLSPLTERSDLAVAASTMAVAALFRPLRARVQAVVDRRFFRHRYDAVRTMDDFVSRLRHEVDLEAVGADLRATVRSTVAPASVSLWLRGAP